MSRPIIGLSILGIVFIFQLMILRGDFGPDMRYGSQLFWGIRECAQWKR